MRLRGEQGAMRRRNYVLLWKLMSKHRYCVTDMDARHAAQHKVTLRLSCQLKEGRARKRGARRNRNGQRASARASFIRGELNCSGDTCCGVAGAADASALKERPDWLHASVSLKCQHGIQWTTLKSCQR
jgi:hypothetical protein